jgi:hypothetical protein
MFKSYDKFISSGNKFIFLLLGKHNHVWYDTFIPIGVILEQRPCLGVEY